jgi:hypothetical protein
MQFGQTMDFGRSPNRLTHFQRGQNIDHAVSEKQTDREPGNGSGDGSERDVKENVKADELIAQAMEEIQH